MYDKTNQDQGDVELHRGPESLSHGLVNFERRESDPGTDVPQAQQKFVFPKGNTCIRGDGSMNSMKYIRRPSRTIELLEKSSDPTKANSMYNAHMNQGSNGSYFPTFNGCEKPGASEHPQGYKLVRKKSGEIVKSSLKESYAKDGAHKQRSQSLPSTPSCKSVHFGDDTDVKVFRQGDKPSTISASNSPSFEGYDQFNDSFSGAPDEDVEEMITEMNLDSDDLEGSFYTGSMDSHGSTRFSRPPDKEKVEWKLSLLNFPTLSYDDKIKKQCLPIFLERIFISMDKRFLVGHIAVKNLAFEKLINVRYTLDNWSTVVEIPAKFVADTPSIFKDNDYNRFIFEIRLDLLFNSFGTSNPVKSNQGVQEREYSLCFRYRCNDKEYWDNNNFNNYNLKLTRTVKTRNPTEIDFHSVKPKYSASYLKKHPNLSESDKSLSNNSRSSGPGGSNSDLGGNDFLHNAYYLSSPLLSSLTSNSKSKTKKDPFPKKSEIADVTMKNPSNSSNAKKFDIKQPIKQVDHENSPRRRVVDSKTFKELLDNYCFFSGSNESSPKSNDFGVPFGDVDCLDLNSGGNSPPYEISKENMPRTFAQGNDLQSRNTQEKTTDYPKKNSANEIDKASPVSSFLRI